MFVYPIYNHNWRNISTIYVYITRLASKEIFSPSNKTHREVGRAKDLSEPRYKHIVLGKMEFFSYQRKWDVYQNTVIYSVNNTTYISNQY